MFAQETATAAAPSQPWLPTSEGEPEMRSVQVGVPLPPGAGHTPMLFDEVWSALPTGSAGAQTEPQSAVPEVLMPWRCPAEAEAIPFTPSAIVEPPPEELTMTFSKLSELAADLAVRNARRGREAAVFFFRKALQRVPR